MPTLYPNSGFLLSGVNLNFVENVRVGDVPVGALAYLGTTGVSGKVPESAFSNEVFVNTSTSVVSAGEVNVILRPDDQITVGELKQWSGKAGELVSITGSNFHQITNVEFGGGAAEFYNVNEQQLNVVVPQDSSWDVIKVHSSLRTGLNGDTSISSGNSPVSNKFVPVPEVWGLSTGQQVAGGLVDVIGRNFGGATGVSFNGVVSAASVVGANLQTTVPSGDVWGKVGVLLQSGLVASESTDLEFKSLAKLTGYGPNGAASSQEIDGVTTYVGVGDTIRLSGENFIPEILYDSKETDLSASGYLVGFGGEGVTGLFNLVDDRVMTGIVPSAVPTGSGSLFIYSNHYPEAFPSDVNFFPKYSPPSISSVLNEYNNTTNPASGVAGDMLTVKGSNLFHITGAAITGGALGIGTYGSSALVGGAQGTSLRVIVGNDIASISAHQAYDVTLSGTYGDVTGEGQFVGYGNPSISTIDPITDIAPNATGVITGTNLYSGTSAILIKDTMSNEYREMPCSGFVSDYTECKFTYPTAFTTGQYKMKVRNQRGTVLRNTVLGVYHSPELSGFTPDKITVADTTVTASGFFEQVTGVRIGDVDVGGFTTQSDGSSISGISFTVNEDAASDKIGIFTKGGNVFSETDLVVVPGKPIVSGYWVGKEEDKPPTIDYNQVVAAGGNIHVSGRRLHLVEKLEVSGEDNKFTTNILGEGNYEGLDFSVPTEINPNSGLFNFVDYLGRTGTFDSSCDGSGLNVFSLSGYQGWEVPGGSITASGNNLSGLNVLLTGATGDYVHALNTSSSGIDFDPVNNVQTVSFSVPTGIRNASDMIFSGQSNDAIYQMDSFVNSLAVITGLHGTGVGGALTTGSNFAVTGVNFYTPVPVVSGDPVALISGTGYQHGVTGEIMNVITASLCETGLSGVNSTFVSSIQAETSNTFIGTGNLVLLNAGDPTAQQYGLKGLAGRMLAQDVDNTPISFRHFNTQRDYFSEPLVFNGTWVDATGFGPEMGVTGSLVEISGQGFNAVSMDQLFLRTLALEDGGDVGVDSGLGAASIFARVTSGTRDSDTKITIQIPRMAIDQRTDCDILISGGTSDEIGPFAVLPDAPVYVQNVLPEGAFGVQSLPNGVFSYSIYECTEIGDGVYVKFIVSYKQFPGEDGPRRGASFSTGQPCMP
jgi:hypothetical protein